MHIRFVQYFWSHVTFRTHSGIRADIQLVSGLEMSHGQTEVRYTASSIVLDQYVLAFNVPVCYGRFTLQKRVIIAYFW